MTERMKFYVPGVDVPDDIYNRMKNSKDPKKEGFKIAVDIIDNLKKLKGLNGIHITALFWEDIIPKLVKKTNLYPRP